MHFNIAHDSASHASSRSTVLLVDDEQDVLPEYQEFFEFAGFPTLTCADPVEAVELILTTPDIGVVITDLRMARMNGATLIRDMRAAITADRRIDFFILTGDATVQLMHDVADVPVFLKPADTGALVAAIRAALWRP